MKSPDFLPNRLHLRYRAGDPAGVFSAEWGNCPPNLILKENYMTDHKEGRATARAHANIAIAKYWGKRDVELNLPFFDSISFNVDGLYTETTAVWNNEDPRDALSINGWDVPSQNLGRIQNILDVIRVRAGLEGKRCVLTSTNNFPHSTGLASSASGAAAAALAASAAAGLSLSENELASIARLGSGSAARSIASGWVRAHAGTAPDGSDFKASSIFPANHWNLRVFIIQVDARPKRVSSSEGMLRSQKSPFWQAYLETARQHADLAQNALMHKDFKLLKEVVHASTTMMHAVASTANPPIFYITPKSLEVIRHFERQSQAIPVCITLDAGANVVLICDEVVYPFVKNDIIEMGLPYIQTKVGGGATLLS